MAPKIPKDAYLLIIGAMKCGTTSLFSYLAAHPEICPAIVKEPEYFSENQGHGADVTHYEKLWDFDSRIHKYALEASTGYTKYPSEQNVAFKIHGFGLRPKFIYIIRNPFDRITSHINFIRNDNLMCGLAIDNYLIDLSNYYVQLEQYRKVFPVESMLILDFDELKNNPGGLLMKVSDFLGVSQISNPQVFNIQNRTPLESPLEQKVLKSNVVKYLKYLPSPIKKTGHIFLQKTYTKRTLTNVEREFVHHKLKNDMKRLQHVYQFDVRKWGFSS